MKIIELKVDKEAVKFVNEMNRQRDELYKIIQSMGIPEKILTGSTKADTQRSK